MLTGEFKKRINFSARLTLWHLAISVIIALFCAFFVFYILYPFPYQKISGSANIFLLMILVDVSCGPLCTFIVASPKKSKKETLLDFLIIGGVQLVALFLGLVSLYAARPVYEVFENKRFRVVMANEVQVDEFAKALPQFNHLPVLGIQTIGARLPKDSKEQIESINMAFAGFEIGQRPGWWVPYDKVTSRVKKQFQPIDQLQQVLGKSQRNSLNELLDRYNLLANNTYFLPLENSNFDDWIVLLDEAAEIVGYAPIDGYLLKRTKNDKN